MFGHVLRLSVRKQIGTLVTPLFLPLRRPPHLFVWLYCAVLYHSLRFSAIVCECEASIVGRESENCHRPPKKDLENERGRWRRRHSPAAATYVPRQTGRSSSLPLLYFRWEWRLGRAGRRGTKIAMIQTKLQRRAFLEHRHGNLFNES